MAEPTLESVQEKVDAVDRFVGMTNTTQGPVPSPGDLVAVRDALREIVAYLRARDES